MLYLEDLIFLHGLKGESHGMVLECFNFLWSAVVQYSTLFALTVINIFRSLFCEHRKTLAEYLKKQSLVMQ